MNIYSYTVNHIVNLHALSGITIKGLIMFNIGAMEYNYRTGFMEQWAICFFGGIDADDYSEHIKKLYRRYLRVE